MKREGRQHGMVRTYRILPAPLNQTTSGLRFINKLDHPPTAGLFTKVSTKPTNHSKSSGLANTNSKDNKSKCRNNNKYKAVFIDGVHFTGASASDALNTLYQNEAVYDGEYGSVSGDVYEIEENDVTNEIYYTDEDEVEIEEYNRRLDPSMTTVEQIIEYKGAPIREEVEEEEAEEEIVVDYDGGSVTIGEVVVLLEQIDDEGDWFFVGVDSEV